ncbi:hypothetical protein L6452_38241 [Arctium lappa]|uniref:Uncharacterized protein n=1 Tax=Arctium lappa TaxID=4217 RepID=A0ACB8Y605_ARCLA|nr:hypothetical protein L6452_38241 [Arctium lappa]
MIGGGGRRWRVHLFVLLVDPKKYPTTKCSLSNFFKHTVESNSSPIGGSIFNYNSLVKLSFCILDSDSCSKCTKRSWLWRMQIRFVTRKVLFFYS